MGLTVLTDEQIAGLLNVLSADELESFRSVLKEALYEYSTGTQSGHATEVQQPPRTALLVPETGTTTLFMPSYSPQGIGMKVITLHKAKTPDAPAMRPTGAITLYSNSGSPLGILHASTLTAFRTALASMCLLLRRDHVRDITVFGCGEQAYWHVRLALLLRGTTVRHVNIIGRRFAACRDFVARIYRVPAALKAREGWADTKFSLLTPSYTEYSRLLQSNLRSADVIFCCTPSTAPLFDHKILTAHQGRLKGRLIVAIGSFNHDMQELPVELLVQATRHGPGGDAGGNDGGGQHRHYHKHAVEGGVIVVDTLDGALKESGEIIAAGLPSRSLVELGELVMLSRIALQDEDDDDDASEDPQSGDATRTPSMELDRLTLSSGNAMSMVYGKGDAPDSTEDAKDTPDAADAKKDDDTQSVGKGSVASVLRNGLAHITSNSSLGSSGSAPKKSSKSSTHSSHSRSHSHSHGHGHSHHRHSPSQASPDRRKKKEEKETHSARWLQRGNVIYKSVGLGLMDLSVGTHLIEFARQKGVGTHVEGF